MPFATVGVSVLGFAIMTAIQRFGVNENGWFYQYVGQTISYFVFGYLWSSIAYDVAPSGKIISATVMATIVSVFSIGLSVLSWAVSGIILAEAIQASVYCVATIIGCVVGIKHAER